MKNSIQYKENIDSTVIRLFLNGNEITDDEPLESVKKEAGTNDVQLLCKERMIMNVQTIKGDMARFIMEIFDSVGDIKAKLQQRGGIDQKNIRLYLAEKELQDEM